MSKNYTYTHETLANKIGKVPSYCLSDIVAAVALMYADIKGLDDEGIDKALRFGENQEGKLLVGRKVFDG